VQCNCIANLGLRSATPRSCELLATTLLRVQQWSSPIEHLPSLFEAILICNCGSNAPSILCSTRTTVAQFLAFPTGQSGMFLKIQELFCVSVPHAAIANSGAKRN